jgi:cystathionine gamma-synthase
MDRSSVPEVSLKPVIGIRPALQLALQGAPGAQSLPFLAEPVIERLQHAAELVAAHTEDGRAELVLWDAHRGQRTQSHLFEAQLAALRARRPELSEQELRLLTLEVVEDPDGVFSHGTGGAVAATLAIDDTMVDMGSAFGESGARARRDFYRLHPPQTPAERLADRCRRVLADSMELAGFVGSPRQWWRYEWGTARWARLGDRGEVLLGRILPVPAIEGPAARPPVVPTRYPSWQPGVARPFLSVQEGIEARSSRPRGHRYARFSHAGADALGELLTREVLGGLEAVLCVSGQSAALHAVRALLPDGGTLIHADDIYHGCKQAFRRAQRERGWQIKQVKSPIEAIAAGQHADVVYVDSPSNWHLACHDLRALASAVHDAGAKLIVDVTLQPCQPALEQGADVVVCSLSKDISLGNTFAGAIASSDAAVLERVDSALNADGEMITAETAQTIHLQAVSLRDRLRGQAVKLVQVESFLRAHLAVGRVRTADQRLCGGLPGSQLSFHLADLAQGPRLEQVVTQRALDPAACLHWAGTFGAVFTTLEHFASQLGRSPAQLPAHPYIPPDLVRLGLGCEDAERIVAELKFALDASSTVINGPGAEPGAQPSHWRRCPPSEVHGVPPESGRRAPAADPAPLADETA